MVIQRDQYVSQLLNRRWNGKVKIIESTSKCKLCAMDIACSWLLIRHIDDLAVV